MVEEFWSIQARDEHKVVQSRTEFISEELANDMLVAELKNYPSSWILELINPNGQVDFAAFGNGASVELFESTHVASRIQCCLYENVPAWPYTKRCQSFATKKINKDTFKWIKNLAVGITDPFVCDKHSYLVRNMWNAALIDLAKAEQKKKRGI